MNLDTRIYVAGGNGMIGSAICRALKRQGYTHILTLPRNALDLRDQAAVRHFFAENKPDTVFMCAALVGGIEANRTRMADFAMDNMLMTANVLSVAHEHKVQKLLYPGSSCIYPRESVQPIREEYLFFGPFEQTNEGYALAKSFGVRMCSYYQAQYGDDFIACIPANAYGPGDHFDGPGSHVVAALMSRFHKAKQEGAQNVTVWGSGTPRREFIYVDDIADAMVFLMEGYSGEAVNIGTGEDASIAELAQVIGKIVGFKGDIVFDTSKPDGMPRRMLDCGRLHQLGWRARTTLEDGLYKTYQWYLNSIADREKR